MKGLEQTGAEIIIKLLFPPQWACMTAGYDREGRARATDLFILFQYIHYRYDDDLAFREKKKKRCKWQQIYHKRGASNLKHITFIMCCTEIDWTSLIAQGFQLITNVICTSVWSTLPSTYGDKFNCCLRNKREAGLLTCVVWCVVLRTSWQGHIQAFLK